MLIILNFIATFSLNIYSLIGYIVRPLNLPEEMKYGAEF